MDFWRKPSYFSLTDDALCLLRANNLCPSNRTYRITLHLLFQAIIIITFDCAIMCFVSCMFTFLAGKVRDYILLFPLETSNRSKIKEL
ncbi:LOW QUALITY PROTEIN: hypothetical protein MXB_728, partial [Myxobolus squamalis]